ncbi:MAG: hypothetical protein P8104_07885, partial [Gammaproteobacteria bacterium]
MGHSDATSASTPISLSAPSFRAQLIDVIHHRQPVNELLMTVKTHLNTLSTTLITAFEQGTNVE